MTPRAPYRAPTSLHADCTTRSKDRFQAQVLRERHDSPEEALHLVLELFIKYSGPTGLRAAGRGNVLRWARNHSRKDPVNLVDAIFTVLGEQTVTVITDAVEMVIPRVAAQTKELKH